MDCLQRSKIKLLLWKACMDCLPTRTRLRSRGMQLNDACVTCDATPESPMHLFAECNFARECWRYNASNISPRAMEGFREWLCRLMQEKDNKSMRKIAEVMWGIWGHRNSKLWRGTSQTPQQCVRACYRFLKEWDEANKEKEGR